MADVKGEEGIAPTEHTTRLPDPAAENDGDKTASSSGADGGGIEVREDVEQQGSPLQRIKTSFGDRPACFKNTFQEVCCVIHYKEETGYQNISEFYSCYTSFIYIYIYLLWG